MLTSAISVLVLEYHNIQYADQHILQTSCISNEIIILILFFQSLHGSLELVSTGNGRRTR